jgi:hypothetical protein
MRPAALHVGCRSVRFLPLGTDRVSPLQAPRWHRRRETCKQLRVGVLTAGIRALEWINDKDLKCGGFLEQLAKEDLSDNITGLTFSPASIQKTAGAILSHGFLYNGETSSTPSGKALGQSPAQWDGTTVGDHFKNDQAIWALSQKDGLAIWVRPRILSVNANGQPTNGTLGTLLEEVLHKFLGDGLHSAHGMLRRDCLAQGLT